MSAFHESQVQRFIAGYLEAALWSSSDTHPKTQEHVCLDDFEWGEGEEAKRAEECKDFMAYAGDLLHDYARERDRFPSYDAWECAGHDFWLTRNGHGVGYWDRGMGELGDKLTDAAKTFGGVDLYLGDDERVYSA